MKIFAMEFSGDIRRSILVELTEKYSVEVLYFSGGKNNFKENVEDKKHFPNTIFHHYLDALAGIPAPNVDVAEFVPVSESLLNQLFECESQVITMMSRLDYTNFSHIQKRNLYHKYVWYWSNILKKYKPDAILFPDVPHTLYNYVIYRLAKLMGIKTLMFKRCNGFPGRMNFQEDFTFFPELLSAYESVKNSIKELTDINSEILNFYEEHSQLKSKDASIVYKRHTGLEVPGKEKSVEIFPRWESIKKNIYNLRFFKSFYGYIYMRLKRVDLECLERKSMNGIQRLIMHIKWKKQRMVFHKEYEYLQRTDYDLKTPYIYVPLQYQPEASTNPIGGVFDDQLLMINLLSYSLPKGWKLYIKENPHQWDFPYAHIGRYSGYYKEIAKNKNIVFVPTTTSTFELLSNSKGVAMVSGTVGVEAVIRGKPAIIFGHPWYKGCEGVFYVNDAESLTDVMNKIKNGYTPDKLKVLQFFVATDLVTERAFVQKRDAEHSGINYEESVKNIASHIFKMLK